MTRLEWFLNGQERSIEFPKDVQIIRDGIPELKDVADFKIQEMYRIYSEDLYCAGWLIVNEDSVVQFRTWLLGDKWPEYYEELKDEEDDC